MDVNKMSFGGNKLAIPAKPGAYTILKQIDLSGLASIQFMATAPISQLNAAGGKIEVHLGSPEGTLVGTSEFLEASDIRGFTPSLLNVPLSVPKELADKRHDVYIVFVNENSGESQSLMVVMGVEFKMIN